MVNKDEKKILNLIKILPVFIIVFSIIVTYIIISDNNTKFELEIKKIQIDSENQKKELIKNEVERVYQFIENEENETEKRIKANIKQKIYEAHAIATSIYINNKSKSKKEITKLIKDALRVIRFNNNRGYFFIYETTGKNILHPVLTHIEGKNLWNFQDTKGHYVIKELSNIAKNKKEGFLTWWWTKPNDKKTEYQKIGFGKYFEPYDWFIGTGEYVEDYKKVLKNSTLRKIDKIRYGKNGYIFITDEQGVYLSHYKKENIGKNRINLKDANGFMITKEIIKTAQQKNGGYISYIGTIKPSTGKASKKTSYILGYKPWKWAIGTGVYLSDINEVILNKRKKLEEKNKEQIISIFIVCFLVSIILFIVSIVFSNIIKNKFEQYKKNVERKNQALKELNRTLEIKVEKRTDSLSQQTKKVTDLLNNSAQGFLSFDTNFLIDEEYSLECEYLLEKNLKDKDITGFLFQDKLDEIAFFKETIIDALNEDKELSSSLILSLLPNDMIINKRAILIHYKILESNKIMMILTNITDKKRLQTKLKKEQNILKMIVTIVSDSVQFYETKENFELFCQNILLYINSSDIVHNNVNTLHPMIHTYKGLFAQLYMKETVKSLHHVESKIMELANKSKDNYALKELIESSKLVSCMNDDLEIVIQTLGQKFLDENKKIKVDEELINHLEQRVLSISSLNKEQKLEHKEILDGLNKIKNKSLKHQLSIYPKLCQQLCLSLNKSIYSFEITGDKELYISNNHKSFINSLVHVFRNCCDHGIETSEKRLALNKNEVGQIECSFEEVNNILTISITDDGQGMDIDGIKSIIIKNNLRTKEDVEMMSTDEIVNYIFNINFTTTNSITQVSGRGVGLATVKTELEKLDGSIQIQTEKNKGSVFIFRLPL